MIRNERDRPAHNVPGLVGVLLAGALIVDVWLVNLLVGLDPDLLGDRGTFGDVFGASNALFSGMALAGVIYAVLLQRAEIRVAKDELDRTKRIFEEQSTTFSAQNAQARVQMFENTFFQLLRLFTDLTSDLDLTGKNTVQGKDIFASFDKQLSTLEQHIRRDKPMGSDVSYAEVFARLYEDRQGDLGHYFRTLYNVLKFVSQSDVQNKKFYTNILRAQLSNPELHLLLYNGLSVHGERKLKPLLEEFEFFDNLPLHQIKYRDALRRYAPKAFGGNAEILEHLKRETD